MDSAKKFRPSLLLVPIILLITAMVAFTAVAVMYNNLRLLHGSAYDFAEDYLKTSGRDTLISLALAHAEENISEFEDADAAYTQLKATLENAALTISRADSYTDKAPVFSVYADGEEAFIMSLKGESALSTKNTWRINEIAVSENAVLGKSLIIDAPKGAELVINGTEIPSSSSSKVPYYALSEFEGGLSDEFYSERYDLGTFYSTPDIVVALGGKRLTADTEENGVLRYAYPRSVQTGVTLTVPYGSSVTVNGINLSRSYSIASGVKYPFLTRFEEQIPGLPTSVVYQISGLFTVPEVKVVYNNTELSSPDNSYTYALPEDQTRSTVIMVPSYATVKINGYTLATSEITRQNIELPILEAEQYYAQTRPYMTEYTVDGLLTEPVITAFDKNGDPLQISTYYSTPDVVFFSCTRSNDMPDREKLTLRTFGREYVEYFYSGKNNLDANYKDITAMTPGSSAAFAELKGEYYAIYKLPAYKNIKVGTVSFLEYYVYSSKSYSVIMDVPFTATLDGKTHSFTVTLDVLYIYSGEIRRIVNYKLLNTICHDPL